MDIKTAIEKFWQETGIKTDQTEVENILKEQIKHERDHLKTVQKTDTLGNLVETSVERLILWVKNHKEYRSIETISDLRELAGNYHRSYMWCRLIAIENEKGKDIKLFQK